MENKKLVEIVIKNRAGGVSFHIEVTPEQFAILDDIQDLTESLCDSSDTPILTMEDKTNGFN